jgi:hypothetical protein
LTVADIAARLPCRRSGNCIYIRCPVHGDHQSGFNVRVWPDPLSGEARFKDYSHGCHPLAIKRAILGQPVHYQVDQQNFAHDEADEVKRIERAVAIWTESRKDLTDTIGLYYLRHWRGITIDIPSSFRFHPSLYYSPTKCWFPGLVCAVTHPKYGVQIRGILRIFLNPETGNKIDVDENGKKIPDIKAKMNLGTCRGGSVRLAPAAETQAISEGVESGLSVQQLRLR